ncbi:vitamin K epoxide reductase family protein [Candidatus Parcubacteria bacterium]|jgi:uncharacterized membrane protein|nr:MAG: vitamin K epoxide reductase family protein [Candidatus Parcubacteria bacterium]
MLKLKNRLIIVILLAIVGVVISAYSLKTHYSLEPSSFCNFNDTFSCDAVNQSWASEIVGVPVALIGLIGYGSLALGGLWLLFVKKITTFAWGAMALASGLGVVFSVYLTSAEIFSLKAYCLLCLISQLVMLLITWLIWNASVARQGLRSWFWSDST